ncbi:MULTISPECIES: sigma-54-dependent transcriptional regulator [Geobacter]|uniref:Fis family transcriptional regulator n=2 Tax=Geobacter TaxID=28231 RepID=A0A0C1U1F3_9BACT|nr:MULTISPECIES: sigma-54 dependent transcriptional regulator [Geobacter]KIE41620.1 Fis family transcriptional regulator [Geobacter soli]MBE2887474.1 sigma-54-dependent Fis family transcriptional regulator [Geobacter anodireducens]HMN03671.1 sigma-54 dependent transcriptional regulator [Geobacter anodireducens]
MEKILIIDDEAFIRENVERILTEDGYQALCAASGTEAREIVADEDVDLVLLDLNLGTEDGIEVLKELKILDPELLVIIITGFGSVESAVDALKLGAFHYMKKPFKADALRVIVKLALQTQTLRREVRNLRKGDLTLFENVPLVGAGEGLKEIIRQVKEVARFPLSTVLITGESGTGKELVARTIHHLSDRREAPFVAINCASMPVSLLESELFGHEKGAFTDASQRKPGLFEEAQKGTIFLDEIGEMDVSIQAKLLRVLEDRKIRRVGGTRNIDIDVRVIAATNRNLRDAIREGNFREDLYYRLNVFPIHIPPLRERKEDIPVLAKFYLDRYGRTFNRSFQTISAKALRLLETHPWPGNIREMKNVIERICIMHDGPELTPNHLPPEIKQTEGAAAPPATDVTADLALGLEAATDRYEKQLIAAALDMTGNNVLQAAQILKIPRGTLRYKMARHGLHGGGSDGG